MIMVMNFSELEVDKSNDDVLYNDKLHKYWTKDSNQSCVSVTTLIHNYTVFDEDFWSSYKALEAILGEKRFKEEIKSTLLDTKKFNLKHLEQTNVSEDVFNEKKIEILKDWEEKRETSCIRGTAIHRQHELEHLAGRTKELQHLGLGGKFKPNTSNKIEPGKNIYPELLLSRISNDGKLRLAGQADLVIVDDFDVYILDYKSSKTIDLKSYYDRKTKKYSTLKYPLNNIQDTNFWHYTLQLSTYAWMIQKYDPRFEIKALLLLHYDHDGGNTTYECEYLKNDVERMLAHYKKQIENEESKRRNEKIIF